MYQIFMGKDYHHNLLVPFWTSKRGIVLQCIADDPKGVAYKVCSVCVFQLEQLLANQEI